ncbi:MAG TPA: hypothetical protein VMP01_17320 [Pirellulaceae bacterium]|nr:hypothetical protein [Pirellulaceae bacterium]
MMWCAECQLDAPALAVPEEPGVIRCAYCRSELAGRREEVQEAGVRSQESGARGQESGARGQETGARGQETGARGPETGDRGQEADDAAEADSPLPLLAFLPPPAVDDWEADTELRRVERLVRVVRHAHERGDPLRTLDCGLATGEQPTAPNPQSAIPDPQSPPTGLAAWACLTLGLMAFVCGGVLVGWSFVADRGDLWSLGLPLTLGGQVGLVLGLLLQLDGLSQSTRRTEQTLTDLDGQLGRLREVTALVSATHSAPAHSFYAHLSAGASPQILLADLKGQLDLLAQQMARKRNAA